MPNQKSQTSGIVLMLYSCFSFSLMALFVKLASRSVPSLEIVFFRSLIGTLMLLSVMIPKKISILGKRKRLLMALRGLSGFAALSLYFYTIGRIPLGTAVMLNYTSPIFAAMLAVVFLKERPSLLLIAMTFISFIGVWLLVGGSLSEWNLKVFLGLLSAVFAALAYTFIRAIRHHESPFTIILYFTSISTAGSVFFLHFGFVWPDLLHWLYLAGVGISSFYGQLYMTVAFRRAPSSLLNPLSYTTPLFGFLYGLALFGETMNWKALLGAVLIVASGCLISIFQIKMIEPE